jgi:hypothetical protein
MMELIKNDYLKNFAWGKLYLTSIVKKHKFLKGVYFEDSYWQHYIINEITKDNKNDNIDEIIKETEIDNESLEIEENKENIRNKLNELSETINITNLYNEN